MRAVVYCTETGEIKRQMNGSIPLKKQNIGAKEGILTDESVVFPNSLEDKRVDPETLEIVEDPNHTPVMKKSTGQIEISAETKSRFRDARSRDDFQSQLDCLFKTVTGEEP